MRPRFAPLLLSALLLTNLSFAVQASTQVYMGDSQGVLGGYSIPLNASAGAVSGGGFIDEGPQIVEIYTATWCENCVPAESALMDSIEGEYVTVLANHRYIGEVEDPFGTQEGDDRWTSLYGQASLDATSYYERAAPTMVFDGTHLKAGSTPLGDSLEEDYAAMFADIHEYKSHHVSSTFTWTPIDNTSGTLQWQFDLQPEWEYLTWTSRAMVVEESAYFPNGSNGLEHYEHVVRAVLDLDGLGGEETLVIPEAWDGDDLSLVLVHEWNAPTVVVEPEEGGILGLPGFLAPMALVALLVAALRRRNP